MKIDEKFVKGRVISLKYVFKGMWLLVSGEPSAMVQTALFVVFAALGFYFGITPTEWVAQIICCGAILTAEALNTAIERICDFIQPNYDKRIGFIKDIAAGAVGFAATAGGLVVIVIYYKYIAQLFVGM